MAKVMTEFFAPSASSSALAIGVIVAHPMLTGACTPTGT
jgi:hypothetical protein